MALLNLVAVVLLALLDCHHLGGTTLAGNAVLGTGGGSAGGTTGVVHHLLHAMGDLGPVGLVAQDDVFHRILVHRRLAFDGLGQVRTVPFALAGDQRDRLGHLQRRGLHVALADTENQGFTWEPGLAAGSALPFAGRHQAGGLLEHVEGDFRPRPNLFM